MANEFKRNLSATYNIPKPKEPEKPEEPEKKPEVVVTPRVKTTLSKSPSVKKDNVLEKVEKNVIVEAREEIKPKKKKSRLWLRILLVTLLALVFLSACVFTAFFVIHTINQKDMTVVYTSVVVKGDESISFETREYVYDYEEVGEYTLTTLNKKDLSFKWKNESEKRYEIEIKFDRNKALRFREYNLYNGTYTYENLFEIDFENNTPNFFSKFVKGDDGYYYFDMNSQSQDTYTLIFTLKFDIPDYHDQFNGSDIDIVFSFEQSSDPDAEWGYYSYLPNI